MAFKGGPQLFTGEMLVHSIAIAGFAESFNEILQLLLQKIHRGA